MIYDVYNPWPIAFKKAIGSTVIDYEGKKYLDLYGGHGVISIGHNNKHWVQNLTKCFKEISYYSNVIQIKEQSKVSKMLENISSLKNYNLFLCNSGAEANENALKIASFETNRSRFMAFKGAFHGRTIGALSVTDNAKIKPVFGNVLKQDFFDLNDLNGVEQALKTNKYAAVIIEGIQGVAGVIEAETVFWKKLEYLTKKTGTLLIVDEIQSGCGRTGSFFSFTKHKVLPDIITMAKGIGNGFPVAGVLISKTIKAKQGQLGTTFGGSYLACASISSVLDEIKNNDLIKKTIAKEKFIRTQLNDIKIEIRGRGLMLGIVFPMKANRIQIELLKKGIITGLSSCPNTLRILPPLNITLKELGSFCEALKETYIELVKENIEK